VSLSATATEDLFAIGAGGQVVAVDDQSNYPASAPRTKLSGTTPNVEAIAAYQPDLVVAADGNGVSGGMAALHIPLLVEPAATSLGSAYSQIEQLGAATGHRAAARALVAKMQSEITRLARSVPRPARPLTVYHELGPDYFSATSKTFIGQIYALFGLRDIADAADKSGNGYPQLSAEYILARSPDLIVLSDTKCCAQTPSGVAKRPGWGNLAAVRNHAVLAVNDDIASRWGPRIVDFMRLVGGSLPAARRAAGG
jgi:iron complex transport system substrate-binding protein